MSAIIAILASLLLPALSSAKRKGREIVCLNNVRQITLGHRVALTDGGVDRLDPDSVAYWFMDTVGLPQNGWLCPSAPIASALKNDFAFGKCDRAWQQRKFNLYCASYLREAAERPPVPPLTRYGSYGLNLWLLAGKDHFPTFATETNSFIYESRIQYPGQTPVVSDSVADVYFTYSVGSLPNSVPPTWELPQAEPPASLSYVLLPRHGKHPARVPAHWLPGQRFPGSSNHGFMDGHAEIVPLEKLWNLRWYNGYTPPPKRIGL